MYSLQIKKFKNIIKQAAKESLLAFLYLSTSKDTCIYLFIFNFWGY